MLKKIGIFAILLAFFTFLGFNFINVKAEGELVQMIPGASIRTEGTQGLKFSATFDASLLTAERGFFVIYGEATVAQLQTAITGGLPYVINGKAVKIASSYDTTSATISIVLTGIPVIGYNQSITVIGYAKVDGVYTFVPSVTTRSIAHVALNAARAGDSASVAGVLAQIQSNYYKVDWNAFDEYSITQNIIETDFKKLESVFVTDWNSYFGTNWTSIVRTTLNSYAYVGKTSASDLSGSRIYRFFNDSVFGSKWGWLLNYFKSYNSIHVNNQIGAIQSDGTYLEVTNLYDASHLVTSISNFFNNANDTSGYAGVSFSSRSRYDDVINYNDKIYIDYNDYSLVVSGSSITLPTPSKTGYSFNNYSDGIVSFNAAEAVTVTGLKTFTPSFTPIDYNISFYDDETELTSLSTTYTILDGVTLPNYTKDGYIFDGWFDNSEFSGSAINSFASGTTGNKVYYAKTTASSNVEVDVTYQRNGGYWEYGSKDELTTAFLSDYNTFAKTSYVSVASIMNDGSRTNFWKNASMRSKWIWIYQYMYDYGSGIDEQYILGMINNTLLSGYAMQNIPLFFLGINADTWDADYTAYGTNSSNGTCYDFSGNLGTNYLNLDRFSKSAFAYVEETTLLVPKKTGYTFGGWYDNAEFTGEAITTYPGYTAASGVLSKTYYAKWISN